MEKTSRYKAMGGQTKLTINITSPNVTPRTSIGTVLVVAKPTTQPIRRIPTNMRIRLKSICLVPLAIV
jgi:hypothetical protein